MKYKQFVCPCPGLFILALLVNIVDNNQGYITHPQVLLIQGESVFCVSHLNQNCQISLYKYTNIK